jgi:hypothetical protein
MPDLVRVNPDTPCQPDGAHHPHRWECIDPQCDYPGVPCDYAPLTCCVCHQEWPCDTKQEHTAARRD